MKSLNWKSVKIALFAIGAFTIFDTGICLAENSADKLRAYPATNWSGQSLYCEASYGVAACKAETRVLFMSSQRAAFKTTEPFLLKPFRPEVLLSKVREILNNHSAPSAESVP